MTVSNTHIRVTQNAESRSIHGRFDGEDFVFPFAQPVIVPRIVASHIFGFGVPDKRRILLGLGWMRTSDEEEGALEKLKQIRFEAVEMVGRAADEEEDTAEEAASSQDMAPVGEELLPEVDAAGGEGTGDIVSPNDDAGDAPPGPVRAPGRGRQLKVNVPKVAPADDDVV